MRHHRGINLIITCMLLFPVPILHSANQFSTHHLFLTETLPNSKLTDQSSIHHIVTVHHAKPNTMQSTPYTNKAPKPYISAYMQEMPLIPPETPHNPILIDGNDNFTLQAANEGWPGDGSPTNPYRIENYEINRSWTAGYCISISNTNVSFIIHKCLLINANATNGAGIYLNNVTNGHITNTTCSYNESGIRFRQSDGNLFANNTCHDNDYGIRLIALSDVNTFDNNTITNNSLYGIDIRFQNQGNVLQWNIFINNTEHAVDLDTRNTFTYNHWEGHTSTDTDGDGIGEDPYTFLGNSDNNPMLLPPGAAPIWLDPPFDVVIEVGDPFLQDVNATASYPGLDTWWINDTTRFSVNGFGFVTNATFLNEGIYGIQLWVNDTQTKILSANFSITVLDAAPPTWVEPPTDQYAEFNNPFHYDLNATDPSGIDTWWLNDTTNFAINFEGEITNTSYLAIIKYGLQVWVNDSNNHILSANFTITVQDTSPPIWEEIPTNQYLLPNEPLYYNLNASDPSGVDSWWVNDTLHFSITQQGLIQNATKLNPGAIGLQIWVNDTWGNTQTVNLTVFIDNMPPTWIEIPSDQFSELGTSFRYDLNATDPSGISSWWLNDTANFFINEEGIITAFLLPVGTYGLQVWVSDVVNNTLSTTFTIFVQDTTAPTWFPPLTNQTIEYAAAFSYQLNAIDFSDLDAWWLNDTQNYAISNSGLVSNATFLPEGIYWLQVWVNDTYNNILTGIFSVTVEDTNPPKWIEPPQDQFIGIQEPFNYHLNATDPSGLDQWWLNDTSHFQINNQGVITNRSLLTTQSYALLISVNDTFGNILSAEITITVDATPPIWLQPPTNQSLELGFSFRYNLNATDPSGIAFWWLNDTTNFRISTDGLIQNQVILSVGRYGLQIWINDTVGNLLTGTFTLDVVDTTPPTWVYHPNNQYTEYGDPFIYTLLVNDLSPVNNWWINDTTHFKIYNNGTLTLAYPLGVGIYGLYVWVNDIYDNTVNTTFFISVQDTTRPIWLAEPTDYQIWFNHPLTYQLRVWDLSGINQWTIDDTEHFAISETGLITNTTLLSIQNYRVRVFAFDPYGNNINATFTFHIIPIPPPPWWLPIIQFPWGLFTPAILCIIILSSLMVLQVCRPTKKPQKKT